MKQKQKRYAKGRAAKSVLRLPDLEVAKSAVINSLSCPDAQRGYRHAMTNSWIGIVPSHGCPSARPWSSGTECIWNPAISLPVRLTFALEPFVVLRTRQRTAGSSAQTWLLGYGESRA